MIKSTRHVYAPGISMELDKTIIYDDIKHQCHCVHCDLVIGSPVILEDADYECPRCGYSYKNREVCQEMQKFRDWLDQNNINWDDRSDKYISRTHVKTDDHFYSIVNGVGTYGGETIGTDYNHGLLEIMIDSNEPIGWQKAEQVIELVKESD